MASAVLSISLRYSGVDLNVGASVGLGPPSVCAGDGCDGFAYSLCATESCRGYWAVYRVSFTVAAFFLLMMLLTARRSTACASAHRGLWAPKACFVLGLFVGMLFAPNDFFAYYAWVARFVAPLFLLYQIVCFLDFGYTVNEALLAKDERRDLFFGCSNGGSAYKGVMLLISLALLLGALVGLGALYHFFPPACPFNATAVTTTLVLGVLNTAVSISALSEHGNIFVASLVLSYTTYLAYSTLSAFPEPECNAYATTTSAETSWIVVSCVIAGGTVGYIAYKLGKRHMGGNAMTGKTPEAPPEAPVSHDVVTVKVDATATDGAGAGAGGAPAAPKPEPVEARSYLSYHFAMLLIAVYMAMLFTDWGVPAAAASAKYNVGYASAWLQMCVNWLVNLLYLWTLIAPRLCPHRDFSGSAS